MSSVVKLKTKEFADMLSRASKCTLKSSPDVQAGLVEIKLKNGVLSLRTTDTRNKLVLRKSGIEGADFNTVIGIPVFEKIISKTSKEEIILTIDDVGVEVKGNGTYKFERMMEGDMPVEFEPISLIADPEVKVEFETKLLKDIIKYNGDSIGSAFVDPTISGYYFGDNDVMTTDGYNACFYHNKLFDTPVMLYDTTMALLGDFEDEKVVFLKKGTEIQFYSASGLLTSHIHQYTDEFPAEPLSAFLDGVHPSSVSVSVKEAKEVLERVFLFVGDNNNDGVATMSFEESGIVLTDKAGRVNEVIAYKNPKNFKPFICKISIPGLLSMVDIDISDEISVNFGNEVSIRIDVGDITRVLALSDDDSASGDTDIFETAQESPSVESDEDIGTLEEFEASSEGSLADIEW